MKASDSIAGVMLGHSYQIQLPPKSTKMPGLRLILSLIKWVLANKDDHALLLKCCKTLVLTYISSYKTFGVTSQPIISRTRA